jgi:glucokinase
VTGNGAATPAGSRTTDSATAGRLAIGIDIGGTKIAGAVVDAAGGLVVESRRPTPASDVAATADAIADLITELRGGHEIDAVGVGAAGWIDAARRMIYFAPNLAWRNEPLGDDLTERCGLPVRLENDANAAAWGEYRFGAARGTSSSVTVTIGTGIGGGLVIAGAPYRGGFGIAGEIGHMQVVPDGRPCPCGNAGCWEQYASGSALVRSARERAAQRPGQAYTLLGLAGGDASKITGVDVTAAAEDGDMVALAAFADVGAWLGRGLADLVAVLDPECFVLGGGVSDAGELILEPARAAYEAHITGHGQRPYADLRLAEHTNDAGVIGAADLARRDHG